MATFDATLSGSKATSYIDLARATELVTDTPQEATWTAMSEAEQKSALNVATMWLETLTYGGSRCGIPSSDDPSKPQSLKWPRSGVTCEGYTASCDLIPYRLEWAEVILAIQLHQNPNAIIPPAGGGNTQAGVFVSKNQLGDLVQEFTEYSNSDSASANDCTSCGNPELINKFPWLSDLLACWLDQDSITTGGGRVILRVRS
jgi:hypothetical protein